MPEYTYAKLIALDMAYGGLTKRQAVLSRTLDRRFKKAANHILAGRTPTCRLERRAEADLFDFLADTPPY